MTDTDTGIDTNTDTSLETDEPQARRQLVEAAVLREAPALLAYLTRRVPDPADAADLLGDVLLVVWRRVDSMPREPGPARMWMFGIARRTLAGSHRTTRRRRALTERLRRELATAAGTADLTGSAVPGQHDAHDRLTGALSRLSPTDREVLRLIHWDGFTVTEVGQHLHLRPSSARSRYHRARTRLRRLLESDPT